MAKGVGTPRIYEPPDRYCKKGHDLSVAGTLRNGKCCEGVRGGVAQGNALKKWNRRRSDKDRELVRYIFPIHSTQDGRANQIARKILEQVEKLEHCLPWEKNKIEKLIETLRDLM